MKNWLRENPKIARLFCIASVLYCFYAGGYIGNVMLNSVSALTVALVDDQSVKINPYVGSSNDISAYNGNFYSGLPPGLSYLLIPSYLVAKFALFVIPDEFEEELGKRISSAVSQKHPHLSAESLSQFLWKNNSEPRKAYYAPRDHNVASTKRLNIALVILMGLVLLNIPLVLIAVTQFVQTVRLYYPGTETTLNYFILLLLFGTTFSAYAASTYHTVVAGSLICILFFWLFRTWDRKRDSRELLGLGIIAGLIPSMDYPAGVYSGILLCAYSWNLVRDKEWASIGKLWGAFFVPILLTLLYHGIAFGNPFATSYAMRIPSFSMVGVLNGARDHGVFWFLPNWFKIQRALWDSYCGILIYNPWILIALPMAMINFRRATDTKYKVLWASAGILMFANFFYYASLPASVNPSAGSFGARYTFYVVPIAFFTIYTLMHSLLQSKWRPALLGFACVSAIPHWLYWFYGSPNRPWLDYLNLLWEVGPASYTIHKMYQGGMIGNPLLASWGGSALLAVACILIWKFSFRFKSTL